jgi:DNA-binding transcriptional ArsR family regulator
MWAALHERLVDTRLNGNDRFEVAAGLNAAVAGDGPFWGCTPAYRRAQEVAGESLLSARRTVAPYGDGRPAEWRIVEAELRAAGWRPSPVWQLVGAGAVGSQSLTGIPRVRALRHDPELAPVLMYGLRHEPDAGSLPARLSGGAPLAVLVGRTRAQVLRVIASGATTGELARALGVSASSASQHAGALRDAGLAVSHRHGTSVLHTLTPLGAALLRANSGPGSLPETAAP